MDQRGKRDVHAQEGSFSEAMTASSLSASLARPELIKAAGKEGRGIEQRGTSCAESSSSSGGLGEGLSRQIATKAEAESDPNAEEKQEVKVGSDDVVKQQRSTNMMSKTGNCGEGLWSCTDTHRTHTRFLLVAHACARQI